MSARFAVIPYEPIAVSIAADQIATTFGTPNPVAYNERANVTPFVVRRFIAHSLLTDLRGNMACRPA
ncbi:hypothetical protein [Streptomyces triticisoli]|jgi:hypothetical protein|uniref:hypothetical protein n=1 Tax=Streptomyces triticisoli TaxID=2182797 RepID=UPI000DD8223B|nr:hypothetical protein [Streptomyces triticisoli]